MRTRGWLTVVVVLVSAVAGWFLWPEPTPPLTEAQPPVAVPVDRAVAGARGLAEPSAPIDDAGPATALTGRVVDANEAPVEGATVTATGGLDLKLDCLRGLAFAARMPGHSLSCGCSDNARRLTSAAEAAAPPETFGSTTTDAQGLFTIAGVPPGRAVFFHARKGELAATAPAVPVWRGRASEVQSLQLRSLKVLEGVVTGDEDRPVEGATVLLLGEQWQRVSTDAAGHFFATVADGPRVALAFKAGLLPSLQVVGGPPSPIALMQRQMQLRMGMGRGPKANQPSPEGLVLASPIKLKGRVVYQGQGVAGVTVDQRMVPCAASAVTAADGTFVLDDMRAQRYSFHAQKGALAADLETSDTQSLEIELSAQVLVEGEVRGPTGNPVEGAIIQAERAPPGTRGGTGWSQPDGHYRLGPIAPGGWNFSVKAPGFKAIKQTLTVAHPSATLSFELEPGAQVVGRVTDESGKPVPSAWVTAYRGLSEITYRTEQPLDQVAPDADGRFALTLQEGEYAIEATAQGYLPTSMVVRSPSRAVEVALSRGARLSGVVRTEQGQPLGGFSVTAQLEAEENAPTDSGRRGSTSYGGHSEPDGSWKLPGLPAGTYRVVARQSTLAAVPVTVSLSRTEVRRLELIVPEGGSITGVVRDQAGRAVEQATVTMARHRLSGHFMGREFPDATSATTNSLGEFRLEHVQEGEWFVQATRRGYAASDNTAAAAGSKGVVLLVEKTGVISGRVTGDRGPVEAFFVNGELFTDPGGRFEIGRPPTRPRYEQARPFRLQVRAEGYVEKLTELTFKTEGSVDVGEVRLLRGRAVTGRVLDGDGQPAPGATVRCRVAEAFCGGASTDEKGRFTLQPAPDEQLSLEAVKDGWRPARAAVGLATSAVELRLSRGARLSGRAVDQDGRAMSGFSLRLGGPAAEAGSGDVTVTPEGTFEISGLAPGELRLHPQPRGSLPETLWIPTTRVQINDGANAAVTIRGRTRGAHVRALPARPEDCPMFSASLFDGTVNRLAVRLEDGRQGLMSNGAADFTLVGPGPHTLVYVCFGDPLSRTFNVRAEETITLKLEAPARRVVDPDEADEP